MNMAFSMTAPQVLSKQKTVTRRMSTRVRKGHLVQPILKGQGLKKGQKVKRLGYLIEITDVRQEQLCEMTRRPDYGNEECRKEGFPNLTPVGFVKMFCETHRCDPDDTVYRIEFKYL